MIVFLVVCESIREMMFIFLVVKFIFKDNFMLRFNKILFIKVFIKILLVICLIGSSIVIIDMYIMFIKLRIVVCFFILRNFNINIGIFKIKINVFVFILIWNYLYKSEEMIWVILFIFVEKILVGIKK